MPVRGILDQPLWSIYSKQIVGICLEFQESQGTPETNPHALT